jgi:hypothetical protein
MIGAAGVGMAANLVGGIMQGIAASQAAKEMQKEFAKEMSRQRGFQSEAQSIWGPMVAGMGRESADAAIATGRAERNAAYAGAAPLGATPAYTVPLRDRLKTAMIGDLRAKLGGYQDWMFGQAQDVQHAQQGLNRVSDKAAGSSSVFPYRMNDAQHSWDELAFWGQLISSIGGSAPNFSGMMGGASGVPAGTVTTGFKSYSPKSIEGQFPQYAW